MANLPFRFRKFLEGVRPSSIERRALRAAHLWVRRVISRSPELRPLVVSVFLQGSYRRATAIGARDGSPGSDVDLVVVTALDRKAHSPEGILRMVAPILEREGVVVRTQGRSLRIDRDGVSLDLVVTSAPSQTELALISGESSADALDDEEGPSEAERQAWRLEPLWIPDREAKRWRATHPLAQLAKTREKNQATGGHYVNVVKVTRAWALRAGLAIKGYPLERLVEATCPDDIESVAEGFTRTLEALAADYRGSSKPKLAGHGVRGQDVLARVSEEDWGRLIACAREASVVARKALEEPDEGASAAAWAGLLGPGFPTGTVVAAAPPVAEPMRETWLRRIEERRRLVAQGLDQLHELKRAMRRVVETLDLRIVWDPSSPPELRDVIGVAALDAARGALIGGGVGLLVGALTREPNKLMWVGVAVGALWGGIRGVERVRKGWRIRCWYDPQGEPCAEMVPIE